MHDLFKYKLNEDKMYTRKKNRIKEICYLN